MRTMHADTDDSNLPITDADRRDEIVRLEDEIEALVETLERCRKIDVASKIAMMGGATAMLALALGAIRLDELVLICAITAAIGGIVAYGSNVSTSKQAMAELRSAEARRAELIESSDLQLVESPVARKIGSNGGAVEAMRQWRRDH